MLNRDVKSGESTSVEVEVDAQLATTHIHETESGDLLLSSDSFKYALGLKTEVIDGETIVYIEDQFGNRYDAGIDYQTFLRIRELYRQYFEENDVSIDLFITFSTTDIFDLIK